MIILTTCRLPRLTGRVIGDPRIELRINTVHAKFDCELKQTVTESLKHGDGEAESHRPFPQILT